MKKTIPILFCLFILTACDGNPAQSVPQGSGDTGHSTASTPAIAPPANGLPESTPGAGAEKPDDFVDGFILEVRQLSFLLESIERDSTVRGDYAAGQTGKTIEILLTEATTFEVWTIARNNTDPNITPEITAATQESMKAGRMVQIWGEKADDVFTAAKIAIWNFT